MPFYEDTKAELKEALEKRVKYDQDMKLYRDMMKNNDKFREQYGQYAGFISDIPLFVLEQGIEELKSKIQFYEKLMELE